MHPYQWGCWILVPVCWHVRLISVFLSHHLFLLIDFVHVCVCVCRLHANLFLTEKSIDMHDSATCKHRYRRPFRHCNGLLLWNWLWNLTRWNDISAPTTTGWPSIAHVLHTHKECASTKLKYMTYMHIPTNPAGLNANKFSLISIAIQYNRNYIGRQKIDDDEMTRWKYKHT